MPLPSFTPGVAPSQYELDWWIASRPMVHAAALTSKSIPSGVSTIIPMDSSMNDRGPWMNLATGYYALGNQPGYYWVEGFISWGTTTTGNVRAPVIMGQYTAVQPYATAPLMYWRPYSGMAFGTGRLLVRSTTPTDQVGLGAYQDSGGSLSITYAALSVDFAGV